MLNETWKYVPVEPDNPCIVKKPELCAECGHCLSVCWEEIGNIRQYIKSGGKGSYSCLGCGQCSANCPEGAIKGRSEYELVRDMVKDPDNIVVFSVSPSVRVGLGDAFLSEKGEFVEGEMISALRVLGADYVLDITFSADLTIMEEGTEFLRRICSGDGALPQFTSCCPAWVSFVEHYHPELIPNLSTAKSPIGMQGATIKTYFAEKHGIDPRRIVNVAVTPCTAKKAEIRRKEMCDASRYLDIPGLRDHDFVITTQELAEWMKEERLDFSCLKPSVFDCVLGKGSGAGMIFGNTGGVMEAALRMAYTILEGKDAPELLLNYQPVRGMRNMKDAEVIVGGKKLRLAVIYGTQAAEECISRGIECYDFIEVMTCPGGCLSGAGQPNAGTVPVLDDVRKSRMHSLYREDENLAVRNSLDNPEIKQIYNEFYETPLSEKSKLLLHTTYSDKSVR